MFYLVLFLLLSTWNFFWAYTEKVARLYDRQKLSCNITVNNCKKSDLAVDFIRSDKLACSAFFIRAECSSGYDLKDEHRTVDHVECLNCFSMYTRTPFMVVFWNDKRHTRDQKKKWCILYTLWVFLMWAAQVFFFSYCVFDTVNFVYEWSGCTDSTLLYSHL